MEKEVTENLLGFINTNADKYTYIQLSKYFEGLTNDELDELEDSALFCSSSKIYEKIQKANRLIKEKRKMEPKSDNNKQEVNDKPINLIDNVVSKLDNISMDQLFALDEHLKSKSRLTKLESQFLDILEKKINERYMMK